MNRIVELIASGRAFTRLLEVFVSVLPALFVGVILLAGYILVMKNFKDKQQADKVKLLENLAPYLYFVFVAVLWLSHNTPLEALTADFHIPATPGEWFYFCADACVFLVLGCLMGLTQKKMGFALGFSIGAGFGLELLQFVLRVGILALTHMAAMVLGSLVGVLVGAALRARRNEAKEPAAVG